MRQNRVTPRMGRVSRNFRELVIVVVELVTPRMGRVSRNKAKLECLKRETSHAPHGACE